jgi:hypothetical protein
MKKILAYIWLIGVAVVLIYGAFFIGSGELHEFSKFFLGISAIAITICSCFYLFLDGKEK